MGETCLDQSRQRSNVRSFSRRAATKRRCTLLPLALKLHNLRRQCCLLTQITLAPNLRLASTGWAEDQRITLNRALGQSLLTAPPIVFDGAHQHT